jgi:hypothetical protein
MSRNLREEDSIHVTWSYDGEVHLWNGTVTGTKDRKGRKKVKYWNEAGEICGSFPFPPDPGVSFHNLRVRKHREGEPAPARTEAPGTRIAIAFTHHEHHHKWTGTVIAHTQNHKQLVVRFDNGHQLLFPPPPTADIMIESVRTFVRPQLGRLFLHRQSLRYRAAAAYAHSITAPTLQDDLDPGNPASVSNTHNTHHQPNRQNSTRKIPPRAFRVATYNARTMTDEQDWIRLIAWMDLRGIDALGIQETRCIDILETHAHGYNIIHTPATEGHHGCALILGPRIAVKSAEIIHEHRTVAANVTIKIGRKLHINRKIISAYFPQRTDERQQGFTEDLCQHLNHDTILLCDANGAHTDVENMTCLSSCAHHAGNVKWTWRNGRTTSCIDHVLVHRSKTREILNVTYEQPTESDHRMVTATLKPKWTVNRATFKKKTLLHDLAHSLAAREDFDSTYISLQQYNLAHMRDHIAAAGSRYTKPTHLEDPWKNAHAKDAVLGLHENVNNVLEVNDIIWSTKHIEEYTAYVRKNPWTAWKFVKKIQRQHAQVTGAVTAEQLHDHFKRSMETPDDDTDAPPDFLVPIVDEAMSGHDFTLQELCEAISTMRNHTATGPDEIPIEVFRCKKVQRDLLVILNNAIDMHNLPEKLTEGTLTPIYKKKGSAKDVANYRPIVLLSIALKILHKMILLRLRRSVDKHLLPCQAAYRIGHSTTMNMVALQELAEHSRTSNTPLYEVFTDFSAAFDSVKRKHLFKLLELWGVPKRILDFLKRSHEQQKLHVRFDGTTHKAGITPTRGVMQGDTLAPYLFILVIDQILRQLPDDRGALVFEAGTTARTRQNNVYIPALAYADDVILLANSLANAQELLSKFETTALKFGLKLNTKKGKTEVMVIAHDDVRAHLPELTLECVAGKVGQTSTYRYLGWHVSDSPKNAWQQDLEKRVGHAWGTLRAHERIWRSTAPTHVKLRLVQALVLPILTYAAATYPLTQTVLMKLQVATNKLLRSALGLRIHWDEPDLHTHTEELYRLFPFTPVEVVRSNLKQWGHWRRAAQYQCAPHPVVKAILSPFSHQKKKQGRAHPPSNWLMAASGCDREELGTAPLDKLAWRELNERRTKAMALDFCEGPVTARRLDDGCSLPDWWALITKWFDASRLQRPKEFF